MLRRAPTVITLDAKDLEDYEKRRQERLRQQQNVRSAENQRPGADARETKSKAEQNNTKAARTQQQRIMGAGGLGS